MHSQQGALESNGYKRVPVFLGDVFRSEGGVVGCVYSLVCVVIGLCVVYCLTV